ncbi:MAG TPA: hypothetical protein VGH80_12790 [Xanthomonadaceae bacterium]|jgi:hypothetical protein
MKAWFVCTAMLLLSANAVAQSQGNPPPANPAPAEPYPRDAGPPPGYQDQQGNGPPPAYQDNGPPPGYDDSQYEGPPPGYEDQQGEGPPPGYQDDGAPPPGYQDNQPPPGYQDQQGNGPSGANGPQARPGDRGAPGANPQGAADGNGNEGFGGWVVVTSDANWQAKWETPSTTMPSFTVARDLARGKKAFVLIFFANPQLDRAGQANVTCDIELTRPDGSASMKQSDAVCFSGQLGSDAHATYLSTQVIGFVGNPGDPAGTWRVKVTLKDNNRHDSVPAQASFNLQK